MPEKPTYRELENRIRQLEDQKKERAAIENALKKSEAQYRRIVEFSHDLIWSIDINGNYTYANNAILELLGHSAQECIGRSSFEHMHPKEAEKIQRFFRQSIKKRKGWSNYVIRWLHRDGSVKYFESSAHPVFDSNGNLTGFNGIDRDITQRREIELELKKTQERYRLIENNIADVIWTMDMNFQNTYTTPSIFHQRGYTPEEVKYQSLQERISPGSIDLVRDLFVINMALIQKNDHKGWEPIVFDIEQPCKDGSTVWTHNTVRAIRGENGRPAGILGSSHNITERKLAEEKLKKSEERYRLIANNVADVIWTMNMDFALTFVSPSVQRQRGFTVKEVLSQSLNQIICEDCINPVLDRFGNTMALIESGDPKGFEPVEFEAKLTCKDGGFIWTSNHARIMAGPDGKPVSILGITHDITERRRAEQEKMNAQKIAAEQRELALVGQIAGKMAHDFNNILGIIMGTAELTLADCSDPGIREPLKIIFEQTLRGKNLTRNLVAFAQNEEPKQEFFKIGEKIDLVLTLLKKDLKGIEIIREDQPGVSEILADPGMIEHMLVNLVLNSVHALSLTRHPKLTIRTSSRDNHICFEIEDNGCGIAKEHLEKIFLPSFTLKGSRDVAGVYRKDIKGTGYGMSNVRKYIQQHKGHIDVKSRLGAGTTFTVFLPVIERTLTVDEIAEIREEISFSDKYILLVEDETAILDIQYNVLIKAPCHHRVDIASNGRIAMDMFDRNPYDFVSLDYLLPGETNGMDVYKHIRKTNETVPVLFVSGNIEFLESLTEVQKHDPCIAHISKPCTNRDYISTINKLFRKVSQFQSDE